MLNAVFTKQYEPPEFNIKEILRYAGVHGRSPDTEPLLTECIGEVRDTLLYKVCFLELPIVRKDTSICLGTLDTGSAALSKNLEGCGKAVLFAATVGIGIDRMIARYSRISPARALLFQAIGAERIESLCELFDGEVKEKARSEGFSTAPRFSPGYGDFSIESQRAVFGMLNCTRSIGVSLNESMLMSPSKSVTAIIGIRDIKNADDRE